MKLGNVKIFKDKSKLYQITNLRINGYALTSLAFLFGCDRSSLGYHFEKYQIVPLVPVHTIERIAVKAFPIQPKSVWKEVNGVRYNLGRSYKDYLTP